MHITSTRHLQAIAYYTAAVVMVIGLGIVLTWHSQSTWLHDNIPLAYDSKYNSGICLFLLGFGLIACIHNWQAVIKSAALVVMLISAATILEYGMQTSFGIDEFMVRDIWHTDMLYPGRVAINTALCFFLMSVVLMISSHQLVGSWHILVTQSIVLAVFLASLAALAGYFISEGRMYTWDYFTRMAPQTATALLAWAIGTAAHTKNVQQHEMKAPFWMLLPLCLGILWFDMATPLGIAAGIAYVPLILCSQWFSSPRMPFIFAGISTILTIFGYFYSPPSEQLAWVVLINRSLTVALLWIVALLVYLMRYDNLMREQTEMRLKSVVYTAFDGLITIDAKGSIQTFNPAAVRIFGYEPEEVIGRNINMLMPEPYRGEHDGYLRNYLTTGEKKIIGIGRELSGRRKDGSVFPMELGVNEMDVSGERKFVGTVRDISERKEAERELKESEERYDMVVKGMSVGLWDWNIKNNDIYWSQKFKDILGIPGDHYKATYDDFAQRLHEEDREATLNMLADHLKGLCPFNVEYRLRHNNGEYVWIHACGQAKWDEHHNPTRMVGSVNDIGARKKAEYRITENAARVIAITDTVLDGLITIDGRGIIQTFNPAASRIFGYDPAEVIGKNVSMLMPDPYHSEHDGYLNNYQTTGEKKIIGIGREVSGKRKDGSVFPMELGVNEMSAEGMRMFVGTVRDISERKLQDELRQKLMNKLMESNTELERFAYIASHDMQEPIRMVTNFSEIIAKDYSAILDDTGKEYLELVVGAGTRMRNLVEDLLAYSRMGNEAQKMSEFDGRVAVESVCANLQELIKEQHVKITCDPMPMLHGNHVQIMRLLQNLVTNAIKYQPEGNTPHIHIGVEDADEYWCITVTDNGLGIKPEFIEQVFQPFRRLHSWEQIHGTGLGLCICKKIVESHGGTIWVTSEISKGSKFHFTLKKQVSNIQEAA